jgi:2-hydroxychromene-2-carboxylate isomerase
MRIEWYFDVISPFAWLQWPAIQRLALSRQLSLRPILFAGLLDRLGQKGPAEIPGKRQFTYRHALWRARRAGMPLRFPPAHPFNPIAALRLCIAGGEDVASIDAVLGWIWREGQDASSSAALAPLAACLGIADPASALAAPAVKARLRENFDAALAAGVFGVPTLVIDGELFWGEDATDFALARLADPALFEDPEFRRLDALPVGVQRPSDGR